MCQILSNMLIERPPASLDRNNPKLNEAFTKMMMQYERLTSRVSIEAPLSQLTQRQLAIADMISQGASDQDIVEALGWSKHTVRAEITKIMEKLEANNRAHIAFFVGFQQGINRSQNP